MVDKQILLELGTNCRTSYQAIANKLSLSVNAIKKRVIKLVELGVIQRYYIYLSLAMMDAEWLLARLILDEKHFDPQFLDDIGANSNVFAAGYLSDGSVLVWAEYIGAQGLADVGGFLRKLGGVTDVELTTLVAERGNKIELNRSQLKVLRCLQEDARMSISEVSKRTRLTPRRVRKILQEFQGDVGSPIETFVDKKYPAHVGPSQASIHFRIYWDLNAGGGSVLLNRVKWHEGKTTPAEIVRFLKSEYPFEFWFANIAANEPLLYSVFIVKHIRDAEKILPKIQQLPHISSLETWVSYPIRKFGGLRESLIDDMLAKADL